METLLRRTPVKRVRTKHLLNKQEWVRRIRFVCHKSKQEALISWTHAEKRIERDGIEYGIWKGELNVHQWSDNAADEWRGVRKDMQDRRNFEYAIHHESCNQQ